MSANEPLIPKHGGYRKLKSFRVTQPVFDITVRFCDRYIEKRSRTRGQMALAAWAELTNNRRLSYSDLSPYTTIG